MIGLRIFISCNWLSSKAYHAATFGDNVKTQQVLSLSFTDWYKIRELLLDMPSYASWFAARQTVINYASLIYRDNEFRCRRRTLDSRGRAYVKNGPATDAGSNSIAGRHTKLLSTYGPRAPRRSLCDGHLRGLAYIFPPHINCSVRETLN